MAELSEEQLNQIRETAKSAASEAIEPYSQRATNYGSAVTGASDQPKKERQPGESAARIVRALAVGRGDPERAARYVKSNWGDEDIEKALIEGSDSAGGYIVPPEFSAEIIELLYSRTLVRRLGAQPMPMDTGTLNIPKLASGAQSGYIGESTNVPTSEQSFGQIQLVWKKLATLVPVSNDLIRHSNPQADGIVRNDLMSSMSVREDQAFIRDDGTNQKPMGLRYWAPASNVIAANATVNLDNVTSDLGRLWLTLANNNAIFSQPGWVLSPRTQNYLMTVRDGNGNYAFRDEMLRGRLWGYPYGATTSIPDNLGAGNESEVYLVDFADAIIGESSQLVIDASPEAAYHDGTNVQAAFSLDQTVIRAIARHDFAVRRAEADAAVLTGVTWGA